MLGSKTKTFSCDSEGLHTIEVKFWITEAKPPTCGKYISVVNLPLNYILSYRLPNCRLFVTQFATLTSVLPSLSLTSQKRKQCEPITRFVLTQKPVACTNTLLNITNTLHTEHRLRHTELPFKGDLPLQMFCVQNLDHTSHY